ncbi:hypothetical protein [Streptomyces antibioticus]|uniref:hypothetical protein n=1 Tax=Streptomyces antibioticus TaxID=1890 RepID=UPI003F44E5F9
MSLPVIAIIISCASALFTASNMLVSFATYRRGKPRVKLKVEVQGQESYAGRSMLKLRFINKGSASVSLAAEELWFSIFPNRLRKARTVKWLVDHQVKLRIPVNADTEIAPFGTVVWEVEVNWREPNLHDIVLRVGHDGEHLEGRFTVVLVLNNGKRLCSTRIYPPRLPHLKSIPARRGQLSLDEIDP